MARRFCGLERGTSVIYKSDLGGVVSLERNASFYRANYHLLGKGGYVFSSVGLFVCLSFCLYVCLLATLLKRCEQFATKFY